MEAIWAIIGVVIGWLLGLSNHWILRYFKKGDLQNMILSELENTSALLAITRYRIQMHLGNYNRNDLIWVKNAIEKSDDNSLKNIQSTIEKLIKLDDAQIKVLALSRKAPANKSLTLKQFNIPLIKSALNELSVFDSKFQKGVLKIYHGINILNEEINLSKEYFDMTFIPETMELNASNIEKNINDSYENICKRCKWIIEDIEKLLSLN